MHPIEAQLALEASLSLLRFARLDAHEILVSL